MTCKEENNEMTKVYLYEPKSGQTIKLNAERGNFNYTEEDKQRAEPNNFTATLQIKMGKRMKARFQWAVNGCKTKKEYRRFKKTKKRINRDLRIINKTRRLDNPRCKKSLERIEKFLKQTKLQTDAAVRTQNKQALHLDGIHEDTGKK